MTEPTDTVEKPGPIQLLAIAFPGNRFKGEVLPELDRLKRNRVVRVLDLLIVRKDREGNVMVATASDLDWEEATALGSYLGSLAGFAAAGPSGVDRGAIAGAVQLADGHVFDEDDIFRLTSALADDSTAALVLIQHTWARPLFDAIDNAGGVELMNEWVRPETILNVELPAPADS